MRGHPAECGLVWAEGHVGRLAPLGKCGLQTHGVHTSCVEIIVRHFTRPWRRILSKGVAYALTGHRHRLRADGGTPAGERQFGARSNTGSGLGASPGLRTRHVCSAGGLVNTLTFSQTTEREPRASAKAPGICVLGFPGRSPVSDPAPGAAVVIITAHPAACMSAGRYRRAANPQWSRAVTGSGARRGIVSSMTSLPARPAGCADALIPVVERNWSVTACCHRGP